MLTLLHLILLYEIHLIIHFTMSRNTINIALLRNNAQNYFCIGETNGKAKFNVH